MKLKYLLALIPLACLTMGNGPGCHGDLFSEKPQTVAVAPQPTVATARPQMSTIRTYSQTGQLIQMWTNVPTTSISCNPVGQVHFTDMTGQRIAVIGQNTIVEGTPY